MKGYINIAKYFSNVLNKYLIFIKHFL